MNEPQARKEASDLLKDEANSLAGWIDSHKNEPHRVLVAVQREIARLREISKILTGEL